ncbi:MAG: hypothetical protein U0610_31260, partial [bacterium]
MALAMTDSTHPDASNGGEHLGPLRLDAIRLGQGTDFEHAHLRACAHCRAGLAMLRRLGHELAPAASAPFEIPADRRRVILANAERELAAIARARRRPVQPRAGLSFALAATLLIGLALGWLWFAPPEAPERQIALRERVADRAPPAPPRSAAPAGEKTRPGEAEQRANASGGKGGPVSAAPQQRPSPPESRANAPLDLPARPSWMPPPGVLSEPSAASPRAIVSRSGSTGSTLDDRKLTSSAASSASEPPRAASSLDTHAPSAGTTEINTAMPIDRFSSARAYRPHAAWP